MKLNRLKNIKQKIISIPIIIVTLISFIIPNYVQAADDISFVGEIGKNIFESLMDVCLLIPDSIMLILEQNFVDHSNKKDGFKYTDMIITSDEIEDAADLMINDSNSWLNVIAGPGSHFVIGNTIKLINKIPILSGVLDSAVKLFSGSSPETTVISNITYSPKLIFSNKIPALKANFFKAEFSEKEKNSSIAYKLRNVIATWYVALRNLALVAMLAVLVYIGIKIMMSSVASDKAKYKQLLIDWIVGICLIVFVHYIMVLSVNIVEALTNMIVKDTAQDTLINLARTTAGYEGDGITLVDKFMWTLIYFAMAFYSLIFTWQYLKRIINLAFLTLFAPLIAASYPIDKMMDGQAQGFNRWLKDYIYTLLIQPLHLILYTVLISSVQSFAENNLIYALVAIGALIPVEKMLREYLGFEKGHIKGPNPAGLLAAGALGSKVFGSMLSKGKSAISNSNGGSNSGDGNDTKPIDTLKGTNAYDLLAADNDENNDSNQDDSVNKQKMLDAYDENYGTDEWNPQEREAMAREIKDDSGGMNYSDEEYADILRNSGYSEDEIAQMMNAPSKNNENTNELDNKENNNIDNQSNSNKNIQNRTPGKLSSAMRRIKTSRGHAGLSNARRLSRSTKGKTGVKELASALGTVARVGTGITIAGALSTAGLAFGIASGDIGKAAQLAVGGATAGYALGNKTAGLVTGGIGRIGNGVSSRVDAFREGYDPDKYKERQNYKQIADNPQVMRKFLKDNPNMSERQIKQGIQQYTKEGITDTNKIQKGFDLEGKANVDRNKALSAIKLSDKYDEKLFYDDAKEEKITQNIGKHLESRGYSGDASEKARESVNLMKMIYGIEPIAPLTSKSSKPQQKPMLNS